MDFGFGMELFGTLDVPYETCSARFRVGFQERRPLYESKRGRSES